AAAAPPAPHTLSLHDALPIYRVRRSGHDRHQVAVLGIGDLLRRLLPGPAGGHEDDLVQPEDALHLAGGDEVPVVDGIEGPTHHADPSSLQLHGTQSSEPVVFSRFFLSLLRWCFPPVSQVKPSRVIRMRKTPIPTTGGVMPSLAMPPDSARIMS